MLDANLPEDLKQLIEQTKRTVWTQKGAAREYQYFAYRANPVLRLKNVTEIAFVTNHIVGKRILDAGAGTGRFSIPLRKGGMAVVAVDISLEMLSEGVRQARRAGDPFPCAMGLIEHLPFPDNCFDSLVSMTVLRHFPDWTMILDEYARVVRPGGRIVFDLASGDQREYMKTKGLTHPPAEGTRFDPREYESAPRMKDFLSLAESKGWTVVAAGPHDFFNANPLLDHILGDDKPRFDEKLHGFLESDQIVAFCELLARRFLFPLSPAVSASWLVAIEKGQGRRKSFQPAQGCHPQADTPVDRLMNVFQLCLGRRFDVYAQEARLILKEPLPHAFFAFLEEELLPRFPIDALTWHSPGRS